MNLEATSVSRISVLFTSLLIGNCSARNWSTVVDPSIYASVAIDPYFVQHVTENDPFVFPEKVQLISSAAPFQHIDQDTPSLAPAIATLEPTTRDEMVLDNGGCALDHYLYKVKMHDKWGDGWDQTTLKIFEMPSFVDGEQYDEDGNPIPTVGENNETHTFRASAYVRKSRQETISDREPKLLFEGS